MSKNLLLNLEDYVRVVNLTGEPISGIFDGKEYTFPDSENGEYVDVHREVARHILGFMLPEKSDRPEIQDKLPCLLRLNWVGNGNDLEAGLRKLRRVQFHEIPPFPTTVLEFKPQPAEQVARVPSPTVGAGAVSSPVEAAPKDPFAIPKAKTGK